jgi:enoyl-CoA hydratase/carnithine racemase
MPKLTVAAVNGPAIGGGVELLLCCDLRYAVEDAFFQMPQITFGLLPDAGATIRLPWLVGLAKAKEFIFSGDAIDAIRAQTDGLINDVFPREHFHEAVRKKAEKFAQKSLDALGMGKQLINRSFQQRGVKFGLEEITDVQTLLISSQEYKESINAHLDRLKQKHLRSSKKER